MMWFLLGLVIGLVLGAGAVYIFAPLAKKGVEKVTGL